MSNTELAAQVAAIINGKMDSMQDEINLLKTQIMALKGENIDLQKQIVGCGRCIDELTNGLSDCRDHMGTVAQFMAAMTDDKLRNSNEVMQ